MAKREIEQLHCEKCGSMMFTENRFRQYMDVLSPPPSIGNELLLITDEGGIRCLTCICGHPVRLGRLRRRVPGDHASFEKSFESAVRKTADSQIIAQELSTKFVSKPEHFALAKRISAIEEIVRAIPRPKKQSKR